MSDDKLVCFKAYDIRGKVPGELNEDMAFDIGRAYAAEIKPKGSVAVGRDIRDTSAGIADALIRGLNAAGIDTVDIGLCGTEMVYYASSLDGMGGGIMVTASHNPIEYNGIKIVGKGARPVSADTGLMDIERRVRTGDIPPNAPTAGTSSALDVMDGYLQKIMTFVNADDLKPLKIVANPGNGCAGPAMEKLEKLLPFDIQRMNYTPDGSFPNGIPNPLLVENREATSKIVRKTGADMGVAWDGDFDRCFLFDETGEFIEGYYLVGFLAKGILKNIPGAKIVHDPRLTWNTIEIVEEAGGEAVLSKSGHSFIKEKMRTVEAEYGGEMSAHHYFREFSYADSGMIPWLLVAQEMSLSGLKLSELVSERIKRYPCSGEINRKVDDPDAVIARLKERYSPNATAMSELDGISLEFGDVWRFNVRKSNTEPVVRLNVESEGDEELMKTKTDEILALMRQATPD
ncbi:phosphomannomutase [Candidatus Latescibacterota bacterium]